MPNSERIEQLISPDALKQFEQLKASTDANTASFEKLIAKAVELNKAVGGASTFKELSKATVEMTDNEKALAKQVDELAKANAKLQTLYDQQAKKIQDLQDKKKKGNDDEKQGTDALTKAKEKLNNSYSVEAQELAEIKVQQQEQNKILKDQAKEALGLSGAYDKLTKEYNDAAKVAKDLAAQYGAESKQAKEASARALELDARLKAADANVGRFNKNVGNYSGALNTLQKALQDVTKKIDDNTKSGQQNAAIMEALQKEQGLLQSLIDVQSKGFASATTEIKKNQQAIQLLSQVYGEDSEVVRSLISETAKLTDEVGDLKAQIKARASDTHVFDGLIQAAQSLAGVYGIAQGAAALFGDENEDLQKTLIKLQAVQSILAGLQGIQNALQKESAIRILLTNGLQKVQLAQTYLQTAAESKNIVVKYAAIAAQKALNIATSAAGGPILLLIGLLASALVSMAAYGDAAEDAAKKNERLNKSLERTNTAIDKSTNNIKKAGEKSIAALEDIFATEQELRDQREQNLVNEIENLKKFNDIDAKNREDAIREVNRLTSGKNKQDKDAIDKAIQVRDGYLANLQKQSDKETELEILRLTNSRTTKEEVIKAKQDEIDAQKIQLQTSLQLQQSIAGNERKTQQQRITALKEAEKLQEQIINKDANKQLLNPTLTPSEIKTIETQRSAAIIQARRESNKAIEDLNRSYAERERKARFDIIKTEIEDQIKADDLIVQNEKSTFDQRLAALYDGYTRRRDIIIAQHDLDIKNDTLTAEERTAIEKKYISDINGLTIEFGLQQQELYKNNQDAINAIIEKNQQGRIDKLSTQYSNELIALDKSLRDGNISIEQYQRQREEIERQGQIALLKQEVDNQTAKVLATKEGTAERFAAEKELADKTLALNDAVNAKQIAAAQKLADLRKELISSSFDAITSIQDSFFTSQSQAIQRQIDQIDAQKQKDIDAANASVGTAQDKADAVAKIEARAQQKREDLERRQRQIELERARFEKAANIAQIIASTAAAVIEALKTYKGTPQAFAIAATIGTIGAINLAKAIATPLPKFAEGTADASGGLSWVGDAGKKELIITPQGQIVQTPAVPTVMNVPKHSIVLPDARAALESGLAVNKYGQLVQNNAGSDRIEQKLDNIAKVIKNKPVLNMSADQGGLTAIWKYGANWVQYTEDQIKF